MVYVSDETYNKLQKLNTKNDGQEIQGENSTAIFLEKLVVGVERPFNVISELHEKSENTVTI